MVKTCKRKELDVDFIGEQGHSLTKAEEQAISKYIRDKKAEKTKGNTRKTRAGKGKKVSA